MASAQTLPDQTKGTDEPSMSIKKIPKRRKITRLQETLFAQWGNRVHPMNENDSRSCKYHATSKWHRNWLTVRILAVSMAFVCGLFVFIAIDVNNALTSMQKEKAVQRAVEISIKVADLMHALQVERGMTVLSISSAQIKDVVTKLESSRKNTIDAINNIPAWPSSLSSIFRSKEEFAHDISIHRQRIGYGGQNSTVKKEINFYTNIIKLTLDWLFRTLKENYPDNNSFDLLGYHTFLVAKDKIGVERALGGTFFSTGYFNETQELLWYAEQNFIGQSFLNSSMNLMPRIKQSYISLNKKLDVLHLVNTKRSFILQNEKTTERNVSGSSWFTVMSSYLDVLLEVQKDAGEQITNILKVLVKEKEKEVLMASLILVIVIILTPLMIIAVIRMTNTIQAYAAQLELTTKNLKEEQKRTDAVLSAMFPLSVAETLKKGEKVNSEYYDNVTVLFSDIVNFTNICSVISPMEVTTMLNAIYSCFDDLIDKYDVYKVETIGDAYMVVSGLPIRNGNSHVDQICRMAFDLVQVTNDFELVEVPGEVLLIRVGIHTGPCVSGIVGVKMPRYCLFGDTVNTASRMQTTGLPQKIHISECTQQKLIYFKPYYQAEFRGYLEVKGKGKMKTFWLNKTDNLPLL